MSTNLVLAITEILRKHNIALSETWHQYLEKDASDNPNPDVQRFLINRFWRHQLGLYAENTISTRHCLIDCGPIEDWLRLFEDHVIPCVKRNTQANMMS